ncbi:MAG: hypothetical protein M3069_04405 [Chloroflexota bacterium]|nr:hypothetical protein [Chloroflexota bacterium]
MIDRYFYDSAECFELTGQRLQPTEELGYLAATEHELQSAGAHCGRDVDVAKRRWLDERDLRESGISVTICNFRPAFPSVFMMSRRDLANQ